MDLYYFLMAGAEVGKPLPLTHKELLDSFPGKTIPENFVVLTGPGNHPLAQKVSNLLGKEITDPSSCFTDSQETKTRIEPNLRRQEVFILQSAFPNPNERLAELRFAIRAAKGGDALSVRAILPYIAYAREDRKTAPRMPVSIALVAEEIINAGAHSIFTMELHSPQSQVAIKEPWDDVSGFRVIVPRIKQLGLDGVAVVSPDAGGQHRSEKVLAELQNGQDPDLSFVYKKRDPNQPDTSRARYIAGDVKDRPVVIYDDLIASGGTIFNAADLAKKNGATQVIAAATHGLLSRPANGKTLPEKLLEPDCPIDKLIITNTIDQTQRQDVARAVTEGRMEVLDVSPIIAVAILCYLTGESISQRLID